MRELEPFSLFSICSKSLSTRQLQIADMARARRSTALKVKSYAQDSGSEEEEDEDEEMKVEGELESEFEETASVGSKRSTKSVQEDYVEDTEGESASPSLFLLPFTSFLNLKNLKKTPQLMTSLRSPKICPDIEQSPAGPEHVRRVYSAFFDVYIARFLLCIARFQV